MLKVPTQNLKSNIKLIQFFLNRFVKSGKPSGSVEIQLHNEGAMAFRPNIYGNSITIIRNLSSTGSGSYRIKSANGDVISTSSKLVTNIVDHLNIQIDNPVCLLTQDTSRNFLSSNDPKNKFKLFTRATKLELLEENYKKIITNRRESAAILENKKAHFSKLEDEISTLNIKVKNHHSIKNLQDLMESLQSELVWAEVGVSERELAEQEEQLQKKMTMLETMRADSNRKKQEIEQINERIQEYDRQIAELNKEIEVQKRQQHQAKSEYEEQNRAFDQSERKKQGVALEIKNKISELEYLQKEIDNSNENMSKVEQAKKERMAMLAKKQEKLKGADDHLDTMRNDLFQIKNNINLKQNDEATVVAEIRQIDQEIAKEQQNLKLMQQDSGNALVLYGRNMQRVKEMIKRDIKKFKEEPRGPLGSYIRLKDKKWAVAAEGFIGGATLGAFTVDNEQDNKMLQQIFNKCGEQKPTIITSKFINKKHDVSRNLVQAPKDCISLFDALVIEDPVVFNCVIDQTGAERILLIPNSDRAIELMSDMRRVPRNCRQGVTITGDKFYPDPNYKTYASTYHRARFLQIDVNEHIQNVRETIEAAVNRKKTIQSQLQALRAELQNLLSNQAKLEENIRKLTTCRQKIVKEYHELNNQADAEVHNVTTLENEMREMKEVLNQKQALLGQIEEETRELKTKFSSQKSKMTQIQKSMKALEDRLSTLYEQANEKKSRRRVLDVSDNKRMEELQRRVETAREAIDGKKAFVEEKIAEASSLAERPTKIRTLADVTREKQAVTEKISRLQTKAEDITNILAKRDKLNEKHDSVKGTMKQLGVTLNELTQSLEMRKKYYKSTESHFIHFVKHCFERILGIRQFTGTIEIDMEHKKLELIVMPQHGSQGLTTTSNLSGGERSFSTVAFLYSLWQCMDFPFYILDEFDVYMDKLNRSKVIEILLEHANSKPELQFVFLTPQDVSFITQNVTLLRLEDPERFNV
ncbi:unnamed protein product [Ceutorhynchus assimilis]|uniref:Structural maintenance of chromosomes protein 6 n=1 Tax=Ceutorhynchus assimilis TaxID=467358 RepID=A0A9N9MFN1_9CUCU|nr:unnamed protein product [Ceutorhynchus assimilis]